ncbi:alpha-1,4-glucan--maltose-1-phosphate maltosyltransferase [Halomonas sp. MCCC 1A17488]|uniref:alpha-1,4-glucan--maltose-1-phosphate maltosyltransferase n=1 Tax=unclassified Halomonas TaxID=2609666 RepID=UPI0018D24850|nr:MULTISPECIES: alpha-1,4-glucan--maltose-1-phosphate maltosyltransferase [unclassified Halomonas]MCE8018042.1 alpha-1,4-glucan--maltose-1-phosphate maltosyltransferase [Halomonas sp. MCCC 1A17488]MCG3241375.1 alpha-1,4-glucan--maltose-1-phosphate maltosyltransferase [Halomonas sp. MCCC 1A17488]QPP48662.1 alpha-1,4-glucan--maltose-1-phosphate maltosyltransferase [Halomonas sp. SS10-MC5]
MSSTPLTAPVGSSAHGQDPSHVQAAVQAPRIAIESVQPTLDQGRFAAKAIVDEPVKVTARIFADGHDLLAAAVCWYDATDRRHREPMQPAHPAGLDIFEGRFTPRGIGRHRFFIEAWWDTYASYCHELSKKHQAGVPVGLELEEGRRELVRAIERSEGELREALEASHERFRLLGSDAERVALLLDADMVQLMHEADARPHLTRSDAIYPLDVERPKARFSSWYELFPRSETDTPQRHGTFKDVHKRLPLIRDMGFDVLYFPPIHPIGLTHRKGPNNTLEAGPDDPGSPYAIGSEEGGHEAIHSELGTRDDFRDLVRAAADHGLEVALDFAIQCSPDHPWLKEHPGWFSWRPDGSIRYAENPPKKYQDIVNVDFYAEEAIPSLWVELRDVVQGWVDEGVKIFRVDNPHTKPLPFWEWLIADIRDRDPSVIFLSEAFTRPNMMLRLGKLGFTQSYTYFTWRNTKPELTEYLEQLNASPLREGFRPNFFVNTPDINPYFLQSSGRPGFLVRAALATLGAGAWGMYSGFELCEGEPVPGKEEYLDSEKYEIRPRDYTAAGNISYEIAQLNRIRRENPALQTHLGLAFYPVHNDRLLFFGKRTETRDNFILIAVSLDPFEPQEGAFELPLWEFGLPDEAALHGEDLMSGYRWTWQGKWQSMRLDPAHLPFAIWRIRPVR